jgi:P pilus assembly chaperone PapD
MSEMIRLLCSALSRALLLSLLSVSAVDAQTAIMVAPTRITLGPEQRSGEVFVINRSAEPITARISIVNRHMRDNGSFVPAVAPEPGERFADGFLQYAPRRVRLAPGQGQTVRVLAHLPEGTAAAEYRSHLLFRVEPQLPSSRSGQTGTAQGKTRALGIHLMPVYGITIPIILRTGALSASISIDGIALTRQSGKAPAASFRLHRTGNRSIYGDVRVSFIPANGRERLVGRAVGLAVYTPLPIRLVSVPLTQMQGDALQTGRLRVEFVAHDDDSRVLAEAERTLP